MHTAERLPITAETPIAKAWRLKGGRTIYVHAGYQTQLDAQLRALGAKWDSTQRALKISTTKLDEVVALLAEHTARVAAIEAIKAAGRYVKVPFAAEDIRAAAGRLGGVWDNDRKQWAMPSDDALAEITRAVQELRAEQTEQRRQAVAAEAQATAQASAQRREQTVRDSGRTATGETDSLTEISTQRMNKHTAMQRARAVGSVVRLSDGRRGLITAVKVWFTGDEWASSTCWHPETHDQAHWDFRYTLATVEPIAEEVAADHAADAEIADAAELAAVMHEAGEGRTGVADFTPATGPRIRCQYGTTAQDGGRIILDGDRAFYRHPGYHDEYLRTERIITDPELVARIRALIEQGARSRHNERHTYIVDPTDPAGGPTHPKES